jgi:hypothetical protein
MTFKALQVCDFLVESRYTEGFRKIPGRKGHAVVPSINGFYNVFSVEKIWCVAIVAGGNGLMGAMVPPVINRLHDMTVGTGFGIIHHIRKPLAVYKRESPQAHDSTSQKENENP